MLSRVNSDLSPETEQSLRPLGCAIEVPRRLGPGFLEGIYQDALVIELETAGITRQREVPIVFEYRGRPLRQHRIDLIVGKQVVVELKGVERLERIHQAQLTSYLRAIRIGLGLLMNFMSKF